MSTLDSLVVIDRLEVGPVHTEPRRVVAPYGSRARAISDNVPGLPNPPVCTAHPVRLGPAAAFPPEPSARPGAVWDGAPPGAEPEACC